MSWLSFDAAVFGIMTACELIARSVWPELFDSPAPPPPEPLETDEDRRDEMAIW